MPVPAKPFGRRNPPALPAAARLSVPAAPPAPDPAAAGMSEALAKFAAELAAERRTAPPEKHERGPVSVPKSWRAALLAGLVVACLHASLDLGANIALGQRLGALTLAGQTIPVVPLIILGSLWSGAESSAFGLFIVRAVLARLQMTHIAAYAVCGGLFALVYAFLKQALGLDDLATLPMDIAMGLAGGFFYRLFAGAKAV